MRVVLMIFVYTFYLFYLSIGVLLQRGDTIERP